MLHFHLHDCAHAFASQTSNPGTPTFESISGPTSRARGKETLAASLAHQIEKMPRVVGSYCALVFSKMLGAVRVWHFPLATRKRAERRNACPLPRFPVPWETEETGLLPRFSTPWFAAKGVGVTGHPPRFPTPRLSQRDVAAVGVEETGLL